jgi:hypothetical protein
MQKESLKSWIPQRARIISEWTKTVESRTKSKIVFKHFLIIS